MVFATIIGQGSSDLHHYAVKWMPREEKYLQHSLGTEATISHHHIEVRSGVASNFEILLWSNQLSSRLMIVARSHGWFHNLDIIFLTASPQSKALGTYSFVHHPKHSENTPQRHKAIVRFVIFKAVKHQVTFKNVTFVITRIKHNVLVAPH